MAASLHALVTAGGTREPIDDVRVIANLSRGRFGAAIAHALVERGVTTTLLGSAQLLERPRELDHRLAVYPFHAFADLRGALDRLLTERPPDLVFMAAAIADYSPVRQTGKISSDEEELVLRLRKNPKLLAGLRAKCGPDAFLVGFKLLSGVTPAELHTVARRQIKDHGLDLTVANDFARLTEDDHPVVLVTPEGGSIPLDGPRDEVAARLVDFALRRARVTRFRTEAGAAGAAPDRPAAEAAAALLAVAQEADLLPRTDGNASARAAGHGFWITPRGADKSRVAVRDLIQVDADFARRTLVMRGAHPASIDALVHASLYEQFPRLASVLHFHEALLLADAATTFPYPPGSLEEAEEIHRALAESAAAGRWREGPFAVHLVEHGFLFGLEAGGAERLRAEWNEARRVLADRHAALGWREAGAPRLTPVFASTRIAGLFAEDPARGWGSLFLVPAARGQGVGERILARLEPHGGLLAVHEAAGDLPFHLARGWRPVRQEGALTLLESPLRREDLQAAVSVCLFDPASRRILLARRKTEPWQGHWTFPGGRVNADEDPDLAAERELREETGLSLPTRRGFGVRTVHVGTDDGRVGYAIRCSLVHAPGTPVARPSTEVECEWVTVAEALARRPLAPGTRIVLHDLPRG